MNSTTLSIHRPGAKPMSDQVFVFGSNLAGRHGMGAAKFARDTLHIPGGPTNAVGWIGGNGPEDSSCYGIATKDQNLNSLGIEPIENQICVFLQVARHAREQNRKFLLTRIGCGLAGYKDQQIAPLFANLPRNCSIEESWRMNMGNARTTLNLKHQFEIRIEEQSRAAGIPSTLAEWDLAPDFHNHSSAHPEGTILAAAYLFAVDHITDPIAQQSYVDMVHSSFRPSTGIGDTAVRAIGMNILVKIRESRERDQATNHNLFER